jgi:hypothetical protein
MGELASPTSRTRVGGGWIVALDGGENRNHQEGVLVY